MALVTEPSPPRGQVPSVLSPKLPGQRPTNPPWILMLLICAPRLHAEWLTHLRSEISQVPRFSLASQGGKSQPRFCLSSVHAHSPGCQLPNIPQLEKGGEQAFFRPPLPSSPSLPGALGRLCNNLK